MGILAKAGVEIQQSKVAGSEFLFVGKVWEKINRERADLLGSREVESAHTGKCHSRKFSNCHHLSCSLFYFLSNLCLCGCVLCQTLWGSIWPSVCSCYLSVRWGFIAAHFLILHQIREKKYSLALPSPTLDLMTRCNDSLTFHPNVPSFTPLSLPPNPPMLSIPLLTFLRHISLSQANWTVLLSVWFGHFLHLLSLYCRINLRICDIAKGRNDPQCANALPTNPQAMIPYPIKLVL